MGLLNKKLIIKNAFSLGGADLVGRIMNALFSLTVVRHLATAEYGAYSTVVGFLIIGGLLAEFGMSQILIREIAQRKEESTRLFSEAILTAIPLSTASAIGMVGAGVAFRYPSNLLTPLIIASSSIIANTIGILAGSVLRAYERMTVLSFLNAAWMTASALAGIAWLWSGAGLQELIFLLVATAAFNSLSLLGYVLAKICPIRSGLRWRDFSLLPQAVPIALLGFCAVILQRFDVLLLSRAREMSEAGIYAAALTIVESLGIMIQAGIGASFPYISARWKESPGAVARAYEQMLRFFAIVGMGVGAGVYFLSMRLILFLFDAGYLQSAVCLRILIWSYILNALAGPAGMLLVATKDYLKRYIPYALVITGLSVGLNLWLIPQFGFVAASWISVVTSVLLFGTKVMAVQEILPARPRWVRLTWRPIISGCVMACVLWGTRDQSLLISSAAGFGTYAVALLCLGEFPRALNSAKDYLRGQGS